MIFHAFLIKYAEIAIKGKNRYLFEDALVKQMKLALEPVEGEFTVTKEQGRVYVFCPEKYDFDEAVEALQRVFGIVGISPVVIYEDQGFDGKRCRILYGSKIPGICRKLQSLHKKSQEILPDHFHGSQRRNRRKDPGCIPGGICRCTSSGNDTVRRDP